MIILGNVEALAIAAHYGQFFVIMGLVIYIIPGIIIYLLLKNLAKLSHKDSLNIALIPAALLILIYLLLWMYLN